MQELLAVALGGSIGAVSRYLVTNYIFLYAGIATGLGLLLLSMRQAAWQWDF